MNEFRDVNKQDKVHHFPRIGVKSSLLIMSMPMSLGIALWRDSVEEFFEALIKYNVAENRVTMIAVFTIKDVFDERFVVLVGKK